MPTNEWSPLHSRDFLRRQVKEYPLPNDSAQHILVNEWVSLAPDNSGKNLLERLR